MKLPSALVLVLNSFKESKILTGVTLEGAKYGPADFSREKNPKNEQMKTCQTSLDISWGVGELKGFRQTDTPKIPASFFISLQNIQSQIDYMDTAGENAHSGRLQTVTKNTTWRFDDDRCVL